MKTFMLCLAVSALLVITACTTFTGIRMQSGDVEIIAHRGMPYLAPENTIPSFQLAWEKGADAVELDVHLSRDGQIVVIHDSSTLRVAEKNRFIRHSEYDDLRRLDVGSHFSPRYAGVRIPLLAEVIAVLPEEYPIYIEIKSDESLLPELDRIIRDCGRSSTVRIISFKKEVLFRAKELMPEVSCYLLLFNLPRSGYESLISDLIEGGLDGIDLFHPAVTEELVQLLEENNLKCIAWTVNSLSTARRLVRAGVEGITTNIAGRFKAKM